MPDDRGWMIYVNGPALLVDIVEDDDSDPGAVGSSWQPGYTKEEAEAFLSDCLARGTPEGTRTSAGSERGATVNETLLEWGRCSQVPEYLMKAALAGDESARMAVADWLDEHEEEPGGLTDEELRKWRKGGAGDTLRMEGEWQQWCDGRYLFWAWVVPAPGGDGQWFITL
jgi:hypothetical protein